jgi:NAD-dependent SIR2 family protein deacetylase
MTEEPTPLLEAADCLRSAREVVVFTGAGVSAESGIPTFRDDEGFWQHFPVVEFATWKGLVRTALRRPRRLAEFLHAVLSARRCGCMIQVGTSGTVIPAAMLPMEAKAAGETIITIDPAGGEGDICLAGTAATVLPRLVDAAFNHPGGP